VRTISRRAFVVSDLAAIIAVAGVMLCLVAALLLALVACREEKKPSSSNKRARLEEAMAQGAKEQSAVATFANALREVIDWRQTQPAMNEALEEN
jgi:hypothetical protein